jgi:hypothetical protein
MLSPFGYFVLFTLPLVIFSLFCTLPPRRAVIYSYIWGWFFLPFGGIAVHGLSEYSKLSITPLCVLFCAICFHTDRILALRPRIWDVPMFVLFICPFLSSLHNDLGVYDGFNASLSQFYFWAGAYIIGRIYFTDLESLSDLAFGFILGGLLYVPLCLYEVRMSPQLHAKLYGFSQHQFAQTIRLGGYRPSVFMQHGIALGVWMISTALVAWWLWICGTFRFRWRLPAAAWVVVLFVTVVLCRALEAAVLMLIGMAVLFAVKKIRPLGQLGVLLLVLTPPVYTFVRAEHLWSGAAMVQLSQMISADRAHSLAFRLHNEDLLLVRAMQSPIYGWGGWDRSMATDENGRAIAVPDQYWMIALGKTGLIGLISLQAALLLPIVVLLKRVPLRYWSNPAAAPAAVLAVIVALHMWDCLLNAMVNPMFMLACGGITGLMPVTFRVVQRQTSPPAPPATAQLPNAAVARLNAQ